MRIRTLWLILTLIGLLLALTACEGSATSATPSAIPLATATSATSSNPPTMSDTTLSTPTTVPVAAVQSTDTPASPPKTSDLTVGSTGETNGLKVTLNEVRHESSGSIAPKEGHEYLIVNLTVENTTKDAKAVSSLLNLTVKDGTGQSYTIALGASTKSSMDGSVAAGDKLRGESAFEIPKDAKGLVFIFDPVFGGDQLRFKLDSSPL